MVAKPGWEQEVDYGTALVAVPTIADCFVAVVVDCFEMVVDGKRWVVGPTPLLKRPGLAAVTKEQIAVVVVVVVVAHFPSSAMSHQHLATEI